MLYISGLTSYQSLSGDDQYQDLLLVQVDSLSAELDQSPYGLLDDYPGQCYPIDILPAIAVIQRADEVLGTDHSEMISRAVRGFEGSRLDDQTGLPAYIADSETGLGIGPSRGVGISYLLIWAPEIWPETAEDWYQKYETQYWQDSWLVSGVREFANGSPYPEWYTMDVDAGPVLAGYGTAASAFGIGAARTNGQMDQAYQLSTEALLVSWPLLDGTRLGARMFSGLSGAPYLGESALLFIFTRTPVVDGITAQSSKMPAIVWVGILVYFIVCAGLIYFGFQSVVKWRSVPRELFSSPLPVAQFTLWVIMIVVGTGMILFRDSYGGLFLMVLGQFLPRIRRRESGIGLRR